MGIVVEQTVFEPIPTGEYPAKVASVEEVEGKYGPQLKINFDLTAPGLEGRKLAAWTNRIFAHGKPLFTLAEAAFGAPIPEGYALNTDDVVGRPLRLVIVEKTKDGKTFSRVEGYKPAAKKVKAPAPTAPPPPPSDDDPM